jgi:hypothetical protein
MPVKLKKKKIGALVTRFFVLVALCITNSTYALTIYFGYNNSEIHESYVENLDLLAKYLKNNANLKATVVGTSDEGGGSSINVIFGQVRANIVAEYLKARGVRESQLEILSYGGEKERFLIERKNIATISRAVTIEVDYPHNLLRPQTANEIEVSKIAELLKSRTEGIFIWSVLNSKTQTQNKPESKRIAFKDRIYSAIKDAEAAYRVLPNLLIDRQIKLEKERPEKDEFESISQFNLRVSAWNQEVGKFNDDVKTHYAMLGSLPLDRRVMAFREAFISSYGNPELREIRYEPEEARFFATLKASNDPQFRRTIAIAVPNDQARTAKQQLESKNNGLEIELRVTQKNELIWGGARVRLNGREYLAQYTDKDFMPPATQQAINSVKFESIAPTPITAMPVGPTPLVSDDPNLARLQTEVLRKEREQRELAARQAEEKRLKDRLAELNRSGNASFNDDLPLLLSKLPKVKANPTIHVLAIGINDYAEVPDVPFADRSATQFAEIAQSLLGAQKQNVIVLTDADATSGRLRGRMRTLLNRLGPQDQLLFFYAGHGVPSKDGASTYLLAQDGGPGSYEEPDLQLKHLYHSIAQSRVGKAKIFIDACFSGRSGKDTIVFEGVAPITPTVKQSFPDEQRLVVITAGRGNQFSNQEKDRGHRLFSYHLMRVLLEDGLKLDIAQIHRNLREKVLNESRRIGPEFEQEPELFGNGLMTIGN